MQVDSAVEAGREDEEAAAAIKAEVEAFQEECAKDLEAAEPVIAEAEAALNSLDKASLGELKSFGSPAAEVVQVRFEHAHLSQFRESGLELRLHSGCKSKLSPPGSGIRYLLCTFLLGNTS